MTHAELAGCLDALQLSQTEASQLLGVSARTVRRWIEGEEVPGPAEAALRAWRRLSERDLAWRPDSVSIIQDDQEKIAAHRQHAMDLDAVLRRVEDRGGPPIPWSVDVPGSKATLGPVEVSFYKLRNGGFSVSVYTRRDKKPDLQRDWHLVEDAAYCIAAQFTNNASRAAALKAVADDVRSRPAQFGSYGPNLMNLEERHEHQKAIDGLAREVDALAARAAEGEPTAYREFAAIRTRLSSAGFVPDASLVSAVAKHYVERVQGIRILLVKAGQHENAVTKTIELDAKVVSALVAGHQLKYLGKTLPTIGECTRMQSFAGPSHVVLDVHRGADMAGIEKPGLYLVSDLHPSALSKL